MNMKIKVETAERMIDGDHEDYNLVEENIISQSRWTTNFECILKNNKTGQHFSTTYGRGSTESQDCDPFGGDDVVEFIVVEQKEVKVLSWVPVE